jgi:hypothetical protein
VLWLAAALSPGPTSVTPVDSAANSIVGYITGFGCLGIVALALAFGWLKPGRISERDREKDRAEARADLEKALERALAEKRQAEDQRDEELRMARDQIVPLLSSFTATTTALIPLLQELVRHQEGGSQGAPRRTR